MTKYTGKDQILVFNGLTSGTNFCITSVELNMGGDVYKAACSGASNKDTIGGQTDIIMTVNGLVDQDSFDELFDETTGKFLHGATATDLVYKPQGGTFPTVSDTVGSTCINPTFSNPVEGLASFTMEIHINGITVAIA